MTTAFERIRDALEDHGSKLADVKAAEFMAQCPAHDDKRPSLHVTDSRHGPDGQALLRCFAGCENAAIMEALNMTLKDLFDTPGHIDYRYDSGRKVRRLWDKSKFSQSGDRSVCELYRRSEVEQAVQRGETVYLVEGEKDANTVATVWGLRATSAPMGARSFGRVDVTPLRGANVIAVVDRDEEGRKWAGHVHDKLTEVAASLTFVQAAEGKDASDHIAAGKTSEELEPLELEPQGRRLVLTPLSKIEAKPVCWAWRDEHGGRIPAGELTVIAGRGGTGKSSFAIWLGSQITRGTLPGAMHGTPKNVLWVTAEESYGHAVRPRFETAGADLAKVFSVTASEGESSELRLILPHDTRQLEEMITGNDIGLVVLDPAASLFADSLRNNDVKDVRKALEPLAGVAQRTNVVMLAIAHLRKGEAADVGSMITGSGAWYDVPRAVISFARDAHTGESVLSQEKSNYGTVDIPSLGYRVASIPTTVAGEDTEIARFELLGESRRSTADIMADNADGTGPHSDAIDALREHLLQQGGSDTPDACKKLLAQFDIAPNNSRALAKIRDAIGVNVRRTGFGGKVHWVMEEADTKPPQATPPPPPQATPKPDSKPTRKATKPRPDRQPVGLEQDGLFDDPRDTPPRREGPSVCPICLLPSRWLDGTNVHPGCEVQGAA